MHYLKFTLVLLVIVGAFSCAAKKEKEATVGVYYFDELGRKESSCRRSGPTVGEKCSNTFE